MSTITVHNLATGETMKMDAALGPVEAVRSAWLHANGRTMDIHYRRDRTPTLTVGKSTVACGDWAVRAALGGGK